MDEKYVLDELGLHIVSKKEQLAEREEQERDRQRAIDKALHLSLLTATIKDKGLIKIAEYLNKYVYFICKILHKEYEELNRQFGTADIKMLINMLVEMDKAKNTGEMLDFEILLDEDTSFMSTESRSININTKSFNIIIEFSSVSRETLGK